MYDHRYEYCIDPGHGGTDSGALGGSYVEKDITLMFSIYMVRRLNELGVSAILTRDKDITLEPKARADKVRSVRALYCISNHINSGGGEGAEVIHSIHDNGRLAKNILNALGAAGQKTRRAFSRKNDKGSDYYYMHRETGSVITNIVEYAFIDNPKDINRILADWTKYLEAVIKVLVENVGKIYRAPAPLNGSKTDTQVVNAIEKLAKAGVINTPEYWLRHAKAGEMVQGAFVGQMIVNLASKV